MALARDSAMTLGGLLERAETPEILKLFIQQDLQIGTVSDLLGYVAKHSYEDEWKDIITGHFVLRQPQAAVPATNATDTTPARPEVLADPGFSMVEQRPHARHAQDGPHS